MKKLILGVLSTVMVLSIVGLNPTQAIDFQGQEERYMTLCSSSQLSRSNYQTCREFNEYLKDKNSQLKNEASTLSANVSQTQNTLDDVNAQLTSLNNQIQDLENEMAYLQQSIDQLEANIQTKEAEMKERMYIMQSYNNSNNFIEYVFGSDSFSDFYARISSINEITEYDEQLVSQLADEKKQVEQQKETLDVAKANIESQRQQQSVLQAQYAALFVEQQEQLANANQAVESNEEASESLNNALTTFYENSLRDDTNAGLAAGSGDSATGIAIANQALSKLGSRYYWGATGPNYFDCSGLVYWAMNAAGVRTSRKTAAGYASSGIQVSYSQLQVGDVITFNYGNGVAHIGIYIGNGNMVHASGRGSGTVGQYPDQCVKTTSILPGTYFYSQMYNCRRLY